MELLLVIALLGILATVGIAGIGRLKGTAEETVLNQALDALSKGTEMKVVLDEMPYPAAAVAALSELRRNSTVIDLDPVDANTVIARAHPKSGTEPCRQMELGPSSSGEISDCTPESVAAANETTTTSTEPPVEAAAAAPTSTTAAPEATPEVRVTTTTTAIPETTTPLAPNVAEPFQVSLVSSDSRYQWWNNQKEGAWIATFTFNNAWIRHQYINLEVERHYASGKVKTSTTKRFYVPAQGSSEFALYDNDLKAHSSDDRSGVDKVTISVTQVTSSDKDWKEINWKGQGPSFHVKWPAPK